MKSCEFEIWDEIPAQIYDLIDNNCFAFGMNLRVSILYPADLDTSETPWRVDIGHVFLHVDSTWQKQNYWDYPTSLGSYTKPKEIVSIVRDYIREKLNESTTDPTTDSA